MAAAVRRKETWKTAGILILRHQLAVLQRRQPRRPKLNWADRALLGTLLSVIPKTRRRGRRLHQSHVECTEMAMQSGFLGVTAPSACPAGECGHRLRQVGG